MKKIIFVLLIVCLCGNMYISHGSDLGDINNDGQIGLSESIYALQIVSGIRQYGWQCQDDDNTNGVYRICNYLPLNPGNQWIYSTGDRTVLNETYTTSTGHCGIRFGTIAYESDMFIENAGDGLLIIAKYETPEKDFLEFNPPILLIGAEMKIGENVSHSIDWPDNSSTLINTTLMDSETITVPSGEYPTLKFKIFIEDVGKCTYYTYVWFAKNIGIVKIQRGNANPPDCDGCIFVCHPSNNLNTPAELVSAIVNGHNY